mgnify:CR=1 FL=1
MTEHGGVFTTQSTIMAIHIPEGHWEGKSYRESTRDLPYDVPVKWKFYLTDVYDKISGLSYLKFTIRNCVVTIKDLPVTWK